MKPSSRLKHLLRVAIVWSSLAFSCPSAIFAELALTLNSQVHLQADTIEYMRDQELVMAKGQVHIQQDQVHLYADSVRYDMNAQDVQAEGHVVWQDENQEIEAHSLTYNLKTREGKAYNIKTTTPPWISLGDEILLTDRKIVIKNAVTTTCDYPEDYRHYSMKADRITIYSGDYLVAENMVLYIGKVPVFYFPFFVRTIHDLRTPFSVSTGATDYLGNYVLVSTNYLFSPTNYGALYTDYFFRKGIGLGVRHEIALNDYSVLSLYGYGIQERDTQQFRWEGRARGLWALSSTFQGRVETDLPGDGFFSQNYSVARRDPSLVSTAREYSVSTTFSRQQFTLSALFRRQEIADIADPLETHFVENLENLPQVSFSLFPQPLVGKNWLKFDMNVQGDHTFTRANQYYVNHLSGEVGLSQSLSFFQTQNLYSRGAWNEFYQDIPDLGLANDGETHSINTNNTWTGRWSEFFTSSLSHTFSQKLNHLIPADPPDGVQTNLLSGALEMSVSSFLRARTSTTFDLRKSSSGDSASFSYLRQELYLTPSSYFDYLAIADYSLKANALKDLNTVLNFRSAHDMWRFRISGNFVDPNVTNAGIVSVGLPSTLEISGEVSFAFFTNYRISMLETYDLTNSKFETRSISLYRDLHDWEAEVNYAEDPSQGRRLFFKLNLKAFPGRPLTVSDDQLQRMNGLRNQGLTGAAGQFQ